VLAFKPMKRARLIQFRRIVLEDSTPPKIGAGEVLIASKYCGICGTDVAIYLGKIPFIKPPIVLGHEVSGLVEDIGENVSNVRKGDRVVLEPLVTCGSCYNCLRGDYNRCEKRKVIGVDMDGAFSELFKAPSERLHKIPDELPLEIAAMAEPLSVAVHATKRGRVSQDDHVVVVGDGTIGLLTAFASKVVRGAEVAILGKHDHKLGLAEKLGADHTINVLREDPVKVLKSIFRDGRIDVFFDCVGHSSKILNQGIELVRKGGRIMAIGVFTEEVPVKLDYLQDRELELLGASAYTAPDFEKAISLLNSMKDKLSNVITRIFTLDEISEAFEYAASDREHSVKVLVKMD